MLILHFSTQTN